MVGCHPEFRKLEELEDFSVFYNTSPCILAVSDNEEKLEKEFNPNVRGYYKNGIKFFTADLAVITFPCREDLEDKEFYPSVFNAPNGIVKINEIKKIVDYKLKYGMDKNLEEKRNPFIQKVNNDRDKGLGR